jgi:hypothetical protein
VALSVAAMKLGRYRLPMPFFEPMVSGEVFSPACATHAGLLDELADDSIEEARAAVARFATLDHHAFASTKKLARQHAATFIRSARTSLELRPQPPDHSPRSSAPPAFQTMNQHFATLGLLEFDVLECRPDLGIADDEALMTRNFGTV